MPTDVDSPRGAVRTEVRDGIGWVTIARPEKRNALTSSMWGAIPGVFHALGARTDLVAVALQGAEGTFGAGADFADIVAATESPEAALAYCTSVVSALVSIATSPLPTVALVAGVAAGGAAELALACDHRVAQPDASFAFPFARLGVVPDAFTLARLVGLVGPSVARRLIFTGEVVDAQGAVGLGLADALTDAGGLTAWALAWGAELRKGSVRARAAMKRVLSSAEGTDDLGALVAPMVEGFLAGEVREAASRFLARRAP